MSPPGNHGGVSSPISMEIDVALRTGIATGDRAEYADAGYAMFRADPEDVIALPARISSIPVCFIVTMSPKRRSRDSGIKTP